MKHYLFFYFAIKNGTAPISARCRKHSMLCIFAFCPAVYGVTRLMSLGNMDA